MKYCERCNYNMATTTYGNAAYCEKCKKLETYGTKDIYTFLERNNIKHHEHSIKGVIYTNTTKTMLDFLMAFGYEWWLGVNYKDTVFIEVVNDGSSELD